MHDCLERTVNRAALNIRTIERALHEPEGWTMRWGPHVVPATVEAGPEKIEIVSEFPEICYLAPVHDQITLWHKDVMLGVRDLAFPGDTSFVARWTMGVELVSESV